MLVRDRNFYSFLLQILHNGTRPYNTMSQQQDRELNRTNSVRASQDDN